MKMGTMAALLVSMLTSACAEEKMGTHPASFPENEAKTANTVHWSADFEASLARAKAEKKFLLVDFTGSDWCGWCIKLKKEVFSQEVFTRFAGDKLVLVELDFPRAKPQPESLKAQNKKWMDHYRVRGFPTVLILNPDGKLVETTGYRPGGAQAYVDFLTGILKREAAQ